MTTILVRVTKEILAETRYCGNTAHTGLLSRNCAIAQALKAIFPQVSVGHNYVYIQTSRKTMIQLPSNVATFIYEFDRLRFKPEQRLSLTPITFELNVPNELIDEIGITQLKDLINETDNLVLVN